MPSQKVKIRWQSKKLQIQGAQVLRNEMYLWYIAVTKDAAERRSWTFYKAVKFSIERYLQIKVRGISLLCESCQMIFQKITGNIPRIEGRCYGQKIY